MALGSTISQVTESGIKPGITWPSFVSSGIATATNFKTGTSNVHSTGIEVAGINVNGGDVNIGSGATVYDDGSIRSTGIVTASSFFGNVTGNLAGNISGLRTLGTGVTVTAAGVVSATSYYGDVTGNISGGTVAGSTGTFSSNVTISGNLGVAGTITYEDVARVDATGVSTFREGFGVGPLAGIALTAYKDGSIRTSGIVTASSFSGTVASSNLSGALPALDGSALTGVGASFGNSSVNTSGIITATAFVPTSQGPLSHRNYLINGAMAVAQRGTSEASVSSNKYANAPDRWKFEGNNCGTYTVSQSTESPDGFGYSYKFDCTTANTSLSGTEVLDFEQRIEGQNLQSFAKGTSSAKEFAVSFYVKTNKTGTYVVLLLDGDNSRMCGKTYTVSNTNWNRYTLTYPADTSGAFTNDNNTSLTVKFVLVAGPSFQSGTLATTWASASNGNSRVGQLNFADNTSNEWHITGIQLEVGPVVTPFEHRGYSDELARCQRYCWVSKYISAAQIAMGTSWNADSVGGVIHLPVPMRADPQMTISAAGDFESSMVFANTHTLSGGLMRPYSSAPPFQQVSWRGINNGSFTTGQAVILRFKDGQTNGKMTIQAEL